MATQTQRRTQPKYDEAFKKKKSVFEDDEFNFDDDDFDFDTDDELDYGYNTAAKPAAKPARQKQQTTGAEEYLGMILDRLDNITTLLNRMNLGESMNRGNQQRQYPAMGANAGQPQANYAPMPNPYAPTQSYSQQPAVQQVTPIQQSYQAMPQGIYDIDANNNYSMVGSAGMPMAPLGDKAVDLGRADVAQLPPELAHQVSAECSMPPDFYDDDIPPIINE